MTDTFIAIDAGTTNSRAWLIDGETVLAAHSVSVGVRDTARDGHSGQLVAAVRELVETVRKGAPRSPTRIAAAGMITSALGLKEVPHQMAPAGVAELAGGAVELQLPEISDLPITLYPGVRSGSWFAEDDVESVDMMRGEETLCLGLVSPQNVPPLTVLNLGSHWKAIQIDKQGRIAASWSTLSGEMLHAVMTQTILASAVPAGRPEHFDREFGERGFEMYRQHGLSRSLFAVRLWEVQAPARATPPQRLAFLIGIFVAEAFDAFRRAGYFADNCPVQLVGGGAIAQAWEVILETAGIKTDRIDPETAAMAFHRGISQLIAARAGDSSW